MDSEKEAAQLVVDVVAEPKTLQNTDELRARPDGAADGGYQMEVDEVPPAAPDATPTEDVVGGGTVAVAADAPSAGGKAAPPLFRSTRPP